MGLFYICGHSLGAALTTLAVPDIITNTSYKPTAARKLRHYNLASPRTGNPDFASAYNNNRVPTDRIVNTSDLAPNIPLAAMGSDLFQHIGLPVDFTANYGGLGGNHSSSGACGYALAHPKKPRP